MSVPVIVLENLSKRCGKRRGIEEISFTVEQGEIFGFIGPDGAGKSTTIRTLMERLKSTGGSAAIFGLGCGQHVFYEILREENQKGTTIFLSSRGSLEELTELLDSFPKILAVMFGVSEGVHSALGWYGCIYFWVTLLTNSYAAYLGVSCIAKERAQGTMEYLFTKPVRRSRIVRLSPAGAACCWRRSAGCAAILPPFAPWAGWAGIRGDCHYNRHVPDRNRAVYGGAFAVGFAENLSGGGGKAGGRDADFFYAADIAAGYTSRC